MALVGMSLFLSYHAAKDVRLAWASEQCLERLYVSAIEFSVSHKTETT